MKFKNANNVINLKFFCFYSNILVDQIQSYTPQFGKRLACMLATSGNVRHVRNSRQSSDGVASGYRQQRDCSIADSYRSARIADRRGGLRFPLRLHLPDKSCSEGNIT